MSKYIMQKNDISTYLESSNLQIVSAVFTKKGLSGTLFYSDTCKILYKAGHGEFTIQVQQLQKRHP